MNEQPVASAMIPGIEGNFNSSAWKSMSVIFLSSPSGPGALGAAPWARESDPRSFPLCCLPYLGPSCRHGGHSSQPSIWGPHLPQQGQPSLTSSPVCPCLNVFHYHHPRPPHCIPPHARNWLLPESPQLRVCSSLLGTSFPPNLSWQSEPKAAASRKAFPVCCHDLYGTRTGTMDSGSEASPHNWPRARLGSHPVWKQGPCGIPASYQLGWGGHIKSPFLASVFTPLEWEQYEARLSDLLGRSPVTAVLSPTHPAHSGFGFPMPSAKRGSQISERWRPQ